jgi:hypothetical protein
MTLPKHDLQKRRLQILDDETRDGRRCNAHEDARIAHEDAKSQDSWVNNFVTRLATLIRNTGHKP